VSGWAVIRVGARFAQRKRHERFNLGAHGEFEYSLTESRNRVNRQTASVRVHTIVGLGPGRFLKSAGVYSSDAARAAETGSYRYGVGESLWSRPPNRPAGEID
jgi:hypothetical protein